MTLSERNTFFKIAIIICAVITLSVIAVSFLSIPLYPSLEENSRRPDYIFQTFTGLFLETDYLAVHVSISLAVLCSLVSIVLIYFFFERTGAQEVLYIVLFSFSLSFEAVRLIIPMHIMNTLPLFYLIASARVLLFARFFAIFSLFAASIYAAGLEIQRTRNIILFLTGSSLVISMGVPIDALAWDTGFVLIRGHVTVLAMIEVVTFITIIINFFVAVKSRNSREYIYVGIGMAIAMTGRYMLLVTDNWAGPVIGIILVACGISFVCSKLHKIHLWL